MYLIINDKGYTMAESDMQSVIIVNNYGDKIWYLNDLLHREDGPAVEHVNGAKEWYLHGQLHRTDGPAIECADDYNEWWLNGNWLTLDNWLDQTTGLTDGEKVMYKLEYG
jgi:hypothetical protein